MGLSMLRSVALVELFVCYMQGFFRIDVSCNFARNVLPSELLCGGNGPMLAEQHLPLFTEHVRVRE